MVGREGGLLLRGRGEKLDIGHWEGRYDVSAMRMLAFVGGCDE